MLFVPEKEIERRIKTCFWSKESVAVMRVRCGPHHQLARHPAGDEGGVMWTTGCIVETGGRCSGAG